MCTCCSCQGSEEQKQEQGQEERKSRCENCGYEGEFFAPCPHCGT